MRSFGMPASTALVMPPSASTSSIKRHRRRGDRMGQALDVIAAAQRIDDMRDAGLLGEDQLGVAGDPRRGRGRQGQRLVEGIGVQRLGAAEHRGQRLECRADDVVVRVLLGEADAGGLAMRAQARGSPGSAARIAASAAPTAPARRAAWRSP